MPTMDATNTNKEESRIPLMANNNDVRKRQITPPLFPSVPALNGAASYLAETTSYLTSCFPAIPDDAARGSDGQDTAALASKELREPLLSNNGHVGSDSAASGSLLTATNASPTCEEITRHSDSQNNMAIVQSDQTRQSGISMFQGTIPTLLAQLVKHEDGISLVERVRRTMHGSSDDIGWLQRAPEMPPVEDGTERFNNILDNIRHGIHVLPNSVVYLLVPVEKNAREIKEYVEEMYWGSNKRVLLLGHSKGGIDAAAALSMYWPDLRDKVAGLALAQSPYGGSPIASDIMREGQIGDYFNVRKLMEILIYLTYEKRKEFLRKHHLPKELPVVSFHTEANISPTVLATLSRVAQAELPTFAPLSTNTTTTVLPVVVPLGATLAACAQLLQTRYGEKNDGLVTCRDAEVPGSVVVRPKRKLDHAWMVYSSTNDDPLEPDASQVCEALLTLVMEVGLRKKHYLSVKEE
ncbi:Lecithin:cholesterol/phospholipid:diacylglycerol acyltransferase [Cynara cardunculus var. scolymus]|uniref:Lecithin:cholesterol/phospholipid:diacylglycerol acyltransferase n=1 Tax=Cynara cardunculus var. scolymus TaxID=59895 RepID=A0A118JT68_CYNCS|nr:Lecithin:cholesterol/phospholipid:diacylglycerol acyltransferase [Cynara cardunculus var. scolymus]